MRRTLTYVLGLTAVPVGVGIGFWTALLTSLPYCPGRGLGTLDLCAARPIFDQRSSVLFGTAAAVVVLLTAIIGRCGRHPDRSLDVDHVPALWTLCRPRAALRGLAECLPRCSRNRSHPADQHSRGRGIPTRQRRGGAEDQALALRRPIWRHPDRSARFPPRLDSDLAHAPVTGDCDGPASGLAESRPWAFGAGSDCSRLGGCSSGC